MKKIFLAAPLALALYACGDEEVKETETPAVEQETATKTNTDENVSLATDAEWEVDDRLQEPTEDTVCANCNMKVYTKDHEMGVFAAQVIQADGAVVFYDDSGCLLADAAPDDEKFVRDYKTLNWFNVEDAIAVKTDLKSPMNWGYIFFKYQEDADAYLAENEHAAITPLAQVTEEAKARHAESGHSHSHDEGHDHEEDGHMHEETHETEGGHGAEENHTEGTHE